MIKILPLIFVFSLCGCINRFHSEAEERYNFFIDSIKHGFDSSQSIVDEGMVYEDDSVYIRRFDLKGTYPLSSETYRDWVVYIYSRNFQNKRFECFLKKERYDNIMKFYRNDTFVTREEEDKHKAKALWSVAIAIGKEVNITR